ncbi:MAG: DUF565 domain-containing protein [Calothrix sp. MO_167.B42]|nr:DUF565 domain-containing protein [Calothrix sp. MO_167.B42]
MQNTRLNNLFDAIARNMGQWFLNPWRRISLGIVSFLFGFFMGTAVATTAGQQARLDIWIAAILVIMTEVGSKIIYTRSPQQQRILWVESLNYFKVGFIYSLYVEALKLGS